MTTRASVITVCRCRKRFRRGDSTKYELLPSYCTCTQAIKAPLYPHRDPSSRTAYVIPSHSAVLEATLVASTQIDRPREDESRALQPILPLAAHLYIQRLVLFPRPPSFTSRTPSRQRTKQSIPGVRGLCA